MSDVESIGGLASAEAVAYRLLVTVMAAEGRPIEGAGEKIRLSRRVILDIYGECLDAVRGTRPSKGRPVKPA